MQFSHMPTNADLQLFSANQIVRRFRHIKAVHMLLSPAQIRALASNPFVTYVSPNRAVSGSFGCDHSSRSANAAWQSGWTGAGVGVAVIDSGIFAHDELKSSNGQSRIVYSHRLGRSQVCDPMNTNRKRTDMVTPGSPADSLSIPLRNPTRRGRKQTGTSRRNQTASRLSR